MLKALNFSELEQLAESLAAFRGAQLKSVSGDDRVLALRWSLDGQEKTLWVNIDRQLMTFCQRSPRVRNSKKPLILFLKSRMLGLSLKDVAVMAEFGRVLQLKLVHAQEELPVEIEFRLFPQGKNILARFAEKQVSSLKPKPLEKAEFPIETFKKNELVRSSEDIVVELEQALQKKEATDSGTSALLKSLKKDLKKKQRAYDQLTEKMTLKAHETWQQAGLWLQENQSLTNVPKEFSTCIDIQESFSFNLNRCFEQAKKESGKIAGREQQMKSLLVEINDLERQIEDPAPRLKQMQKQMLKQNQDKKSDLMQVAKVKGRRRELSGGIRVSMGKAGADNLKLLRRAKPWYFWFHLKDFPGSHAIVEINKGQSLSQSQIDEICQWLIKESLGTRAVVDESYAVIWSECRYVTPIKGDKLGRVRYTGENFQSIRYR